MPSLAGSLRQEKNVSGVEGVDDWTRLLSKTELAADREEVRLDSGIVMSEDGLSSSFLSETSIVMLSKHSIG